MMIKTLHALLFLMFLGSAISAKEWRGIVPLKSTRADVERLLGKANRLGHYEIQNEKVSIWYSEGPCEVMKGGLAKSTCECLVAKDTVLKIAVTFDSPVKVSKLRIEKKNFGRTAINAYRPTATYSDFIDGVVYTIRESDDVVINTDYLPSAKDCDEVIRRQTASTVNGWQGIIPLRSTRGDVEHLLGSPRSSLGEIYRYDSPENRVDISYSSDPCHMSSNANPKGTAADVVMKIAVTPHKKLLVQNLGLDKNRYIRIQSQHPENWVHYVNSVDAITVDAMLINGCEQVIGIIYQPSANDRELQCRHKGRTEAMIFKNRNATPVH